MANHQSAKKRARQDIVRCERNKSYLSSVRSAVKAYLTAVKGLEKSDSQAVEQTKKLFMTAQSKMAKAATKGILHKNNVARKTKRMSAMLKKKTA
ncbi:MAG: 30S ribosomal protein S20 [Zetaproteobacteria bacterium]|nr:30S ribosomal protein S20 [Zetaproteobacteria bacterium]